LRAISTICCWPMPRRETGTAGSMCERPIFASCSRAAACSSARCSQPMRCGSRSSSRFSATVSVGTSPSSCITMRTPCASASRREPGWNGAPPSSIVPRVGVTSPQTILESVLLPAPFSPVSASTSPASKVRLTPSSTGAA